MATRAKKRVQLGIIVSREMKARIAALARKSGRSQGQVAEDLMLKQFAYEELVAAMGKGIEEIRKNNIETELFKLGYIRVRRTDAAGKVITSGWYEPSSSLPLEPGELASQRGGFVPWKEGERPPGKITLIERGDGSLKVITDPNWRGEEEPKP